MNEPTPSRYDVLIVGAGQGGAQAAVALRMKQFAGTIGLIGDEPDLPYDRPPLSKDYLSGAKPFEKLAFRTASEWAELGIDLILGQRVTSVAGHEHQVTCANGDRIGYGQLIWSTGGRARRLECEGHDLAGVHAIRTRRDVDLLRAELPTVRRAVVVGGGYLGLEAAATLNQLGIAVTLVEALDRLLSRVAGEPLSRFYEMEHRARGVDVRLNSRVDRLVANSDRVAGALLEGGEMVPADIVVVGIGIIPAVEPLQAAGAVIDNGVRVDAQCRTSLADIFAIGDCAQHRNAFAGDRCIRLESIQNANDQALIAASALTGGAETYSAMPWFWSNQYDLKLQTVGLSEGFDDVVVRGSFDERQFSCIYLNNSKVIALDCVNSVRDYNYGKKLVQDGVIVNRLDLMNSDRSLKDFIEK